MDFTLYFLFAMSIYSHFEKGCQKKMCTRQSQKVIWDMINRLFLTTVAVKPTFVIFPLALANILSVAFRAILSNFFEELCTQNHPQSLLGLSHALF